MTPLEARMATLEGAHRALGAQHTALMQICRAMLPLIDADPALISRALLAAYDSNDEHMERHGMDADYQTDIREWIDRLAGEIKSVADIRGRRPRRT